MCWRAEQLLTAQICSAIAVDPSGARIATGSHDYDTKLWDFGGMDSRLKPFKSFEANGNYYVRDGGALHSTKTECRCGISTTRWTGRIC